jgi:hypothetical protein
MPLFKDKRTAAIFDGEPDRRLPPDLRTRAEAALFRVVSAKHLIEIVDIPLVPLHSDFDRLKIKRVRAGMALSTPSQTVKTSVQRY